MKTQRLLTGLAAAALLAAPAMAEDLGKEEYMNACALCHGESGTGDGPLAELMTVAVPDPTTISARKDGAVPFMDIFMVADGRTGIRGHGCPMPVWGDRFAAEAGERYGPNGAGEVVRGRILSRVCHLQLLQSE